MLIFLDMDQVLADFPRSEAFKDGCRRPRPPEMFEEFFFEKLPPVPGSLSSVRKIMEIPNTELHILTKPVKETHYSYSEKAAWVAKWFPELRSKLTLTQDKGLLARENRILIDDDAKQWKSVWEANGGTFIHFNYQEMDHRVMWNMVVETLKDMEYRNHGQWTTGEVKQ